MESDSSGKEDHVLLNIASTRDAADEATVSQGDVSSLEEAFAQAAELEGTAREAFLEQADRSSPGLAQRVRDLLRADQALHDAKTLRPTLPDHADEMPPAARLTEGDRVGPFTIRRLLGRGGMGEVYLAERIQGTVEQRVAIKVLRAAWLSPGGRQRFRLECQILARLEHPSIARLIDIGETADGAPYLAMEYVQGRSITRYCDSEGLDLENRIRLVVRVCAAVTFAHRNLVIHRDLKPQNVLVTDEGHVKLLDFGIAKSLDGERSQRAHEPTGTLGRVFSPAYASPEQIQGHVATVGVDVYGLGVVLYELLTGTPPFTVAGKTPREIEDAVLHQEPTAPSRQIVTTINKEARAVAHAERLRRRLRGDLDSILLKALRKSPTSRYGTVDELSDDLDRFLTGRPVLAREGRIGYRAGKRLRRHWRATVLGAGILIAFLGGLTAFVAQSMETRRQRDRARFVTDFMVSAFKSADPTQSLGADVTAAHILQQSLRQLETHGSENSGSENPEAVAELLLAIARVQVSLGLGSDARATLHRATELFDSVEGDHTFGTELLITRTERALDDHEIDRARNLALQGLARPRLSKAQRVRFQLLLAKCAFKESQFEESRDRLESLLAPLSDLGPTETPLQFEIHNEYGRTLEALGSYSEALTVYERVLQERQRMLPPQHPDLLDSAQRIANLYRLDGRVADFDRVATEILTRTERLYGAESLAMATAHNTRGTAMNMARDIAGAVEHYEKALAVHRRHHDDVHPSIAMGSFNVALTAASDPAFNKTADTRFQTSIDVGSAVWPEHHRNLHLFRTMYGLFLNERGRFVESLRQTTNALADADARPEFKDYDVYALAELAHAVARFAIAPSLEIEGEVREWLEACYSFPPRRRTKAVPQARIAAEQGIDIPDVWRRSFEPPPTQ